ncbi:hypothetical protein BDK51DRAFT_37214 [Blyttiomyces helicus]|uniref:Uncharacterized protein n=1 Tax=Blyttiomyces helicus TaxID=388810 RepID=A0A4P9WG12_9FUNG|nr:hypothetical protein BDK51DRAFT_37214 [Blyttiomyces helicus]|eukprot:RKO91614.1 hypothetical protein BDK51DRAFT_37214 [Blyttiomyces helicus]
MFRPHVLSPEPDRPDGGGFLVGNHDPPRCAPRWTQVRWWAEYRHILRAARAVIIAKQQHAARCQQNLLQTSLEASPLAPSPSLRLRKRVTEELGHRSLHFRAPFTSDDKMSMTSSPLSRPHSTYYSRLTTKGRAPLHMPRMGSHGVVAGWVHYSSQHVEGKMIVLRVRSIDPSSESARESVDDCLDATVEKKIGGEIVAKKGSPTSIT